MLGVPVVAVDTTNRLVRMDGVGDIHFDKLLIATGTKPIRPTIPGSVLPGIHCLHTLADAEALRQAAKNAKRVVVLGGGYLGVETATSLTRMGIHVVLIEEAISCSHSLPLLNCPLSSPVSARSEELNCASTMPPPRSRATTLRTG